MKWKHCIIKAYTNDEYIQPQADWAVFELTEELVKDLERYDRAVQSVDPKPFCADYWNSSVRYIGYPCVKDDDLQEELEALLEPIESLIIVDELPGALTRFMEDEENLIATECDVARFFTQWPGVAEWRCYIKHTSVVVCTESIKIEELRKAVNGSAKR